MSQKEKSSSKGVQTTGLSDYQKDLVKKLSETYSPYVGQGTLGGLSDLEQQSLDMLKSADIWGPLTTTAKGLLSGETGAQPISSEKAAQTFTESVENPTMKKWYEELKPGIKEEYAGPGYWGSARAKAVTEGAEDLGQWLGTERANWMWDVDQANRDIEEAKAGRALSALGVTPSALSSWTGTLFGTGQAAREIENAITDPEVLQVLQFVIGTQTQPIISKGSQTSTPSQFQQIMNYRNAFAPGFGNIQEDASFGQALGQFGAGFLTG